MSHNGKMSECQGRHQEVSAPLEYWLHAGEVKEKEEKKRQKQYRFWKTHWTNLKFFFRQSGRNQMPRYLLFSLGGNRTLTCWVASVVSDSLQVCPWESPGKNTGVGGCFLLQGIFPTQGLIWRFLPWQMDSLPLRHQGSHQEQLYSDLKKKKRILKHHLSISPGKRERGNVATLWLHLLL